MSPCFPGITVHIHAMPGSQDGHEVQQIDTATFKSLTILTCTQGIARCGREGAWLTEGGGEAPEDEGVGVLEEGDPAHACAHPALEQARRVQQRVHVPVAVRLCLDRKGIARLQRQVRVAIAQTRHLPHDPVASAAVTKCLAPFIQGTHKESMSHTRAHPLGAH